MQQPCHPAESQEGRSQKHDAQHRGQEQTTKCATYGKRQQWFACVTGIFALFACFVVKEDARPVVESWPRAIAIRVPSALWSVIYPTLSSVVVPPLRVSVVVGRDQAKFRQGGTLPFTFRVRPAPRSARHHHMPRRLLTILVVLSMLGYSNAWALDTHAFNLADDNEIGAHDHAGAALDEAGCDHCCHASAHLVGLVSSLPRLPALHRDRFRLASGFLLSHAFFAPPLKPPRS